MTGTNNEGRLNPGLQKQEMKVPNKVGDQFTLREVFFITIMCFVIFLTRLPWISTGYGLDPDSYRVINVGRHIAQTGEYTASRLPGYPVHEYLTAFTPAKMSPMFSNGITTIFSCIAFLFFLLILRHFNIGQYLLLALSFSMVPVVYLNSINTMDYLLALAFVLGSTYFMLHRRPFLAGICLGLAIGCRITSGVMLLPLVLGMFLEEKNFSIFLKHFLILSTTTLTIGGLCFFPVVLRYGMDFFNFYKSPSYPSLGTLLERGILGVWGVVGALGFLGLCVTVPLSILKNKNPIIHPGIKTGIAFSSLTILLYVIIFLGTPYESGYLIPVVPFVILLVGLLISPYSVKIVKYFAITLLMSSILVTIDNGRVNLYGPVIQNHKMRESAIEVTNRYVESIAQLHESAIIVAGWKWPQVRIALDETLIEFHEYVYLINDVNMFKRYRDSGRDIYFLPDIDAYNLQVFGVDIRQLGAKQLDSFIEE